MISCTCISNSCLDIIQNEDPEILKLLIIMKENSEEFVLNLCTWSLKHMVLKNFLRVQRFFYGFEPFFGVSGLDYIQNQDPEILKLRIEIMMKENCEEFALNLCTWSLKQHRVRGFRNVLNHFFVFQVLTTYRTKIPRS